MPLSYVTKLLEAGMAPLFSEKDEGKQTGALLPPEDVVVVDPTNAGNDQDWVFVFREEDPTTKGWIPIRFLREPAPGDLVRFPFVLKPFVRSCGRAELASVPADGKGTQVLADYLLAWAFIESATETEPFSNPGPDFVGTDAEGPFRLSTVDWKAYQEAAKQSGIEVSDFERLIPNSQVSGAAFKCSHDAAALAQLKQPAGPPTDGPYVPSYLNVFHCHLLGVQSAFQFQKLKDEGADATKVDDALTGNPAKDAILANRAKFLKKDGQAVTLTMFFELTSQVLADGFRKALDLIRKHADFLLPAPNAFEGGAPWMTIAKQELELWTANNFKEDVEPGLAKVVRYLKSVGLSTTTNEAWCGGFVGFCLEQSGEKFKATIVKEGAKASNWLEWGNMSMRQFDLRDIPVGAIVVTHPLAEGTSGHVGFAVEKVTGTDKVAVLGGNQGDRVSIEHIHKNKIRQIRWHSDLALTISTNLGTKTDPKFAQLLSLIASRESNGNYNAHFGKAGNQNNPRFTTMPVKEVRRWQDDFIADGSDSSAVGKYQIIRTTLDAIIGRLKLDGSEIFDENLQDNMAMNLLQVRKLDEFLSKTIDIVRFGNNLAMEWASFPVLSNLTNDKGRLVHRGQSFYAGDGLNKAHIMPEQIEDVLAKLVG